MLLNTQKNPHELFSFVKNISVFNFAQLQFSCILTDVWHFRSAYAEYKLTGIFLCLSIILKQASLTQPFSHLLALWLWKETNVFSIHMKLYLNDSLKAENWMEDSGKKKWGGRWNIYLCAGASSSQDYSLPAYNTHLW